MPSLSSPPSLPNKRRLPNKKPSCLVQSFLSLVSHGHLSQAVSSLDLLFRKGIRLPTNSLALLLQKCGDARSLRQGKWVHFYLKLTGFKRPPLLLANHLIGMYLKCGDEVDARKVFDKMSVRNLYSWNHMLSGYVKMRHLKEARSLFEKMSERDVVSWNTMVIGYAHSGDCDEALRFYRELRRSNVGFNEFSFAGVVSVCVKLKELGVVRQAHGQVLVAGFLSNVVLSSSLVDAYAKCGEMGEAGKLFDEMGVRDVHAWTTLVSGYAKWGDMKLAGELFDRMPEKNPVSWTSMISGYARNRLGHEALALFAEMMRLQIRPDQFTFSSCLCACASTASLEHGKQIHASLVRSHLRPNTIVVSSLIDMYSKCGNLGAARQVFKLMGDKQDTVLWNTTMSALAQHGHGVEALQMFEDMVSSGVKPVATTFVIILNACSHSGLVQEGHRLFKSMTDVYGIVPSEEHYACLIDLLGRAGCFDELMNQLENMTCKAGDQVWNALLGVCRIHGNRELGRRAAEHLIELELESSAPYALLLSIYAEEGKWELVEKVRRLMDERHVRKERAISWLEVESQVHAFTVSDRLHPLKDEIYSVLKQLADQMEEDATVTNAKN
ncbi:pentatricopeptide repeat-containing protein At2g21090 [Argentina anserina]|uniref:pentatricopeptide repeat-containing protein At2g21090 n=1 Tax=Argentina anserina TaxID=57926 RepID=UPI00217690C0|nr:pentatricopeptide repeat-containing protein At2g21090 [Potentilla anserina]